MTRPFLSIVCVMFAGGAAWAQHASPLRLVHEDARGVAALELDAGAYAAIRDRPSVEVEQFVLGAGVSVPVTLIRFELYAEDASVVTVDGAGEHGVARPDVTLWRGHVHGEPGSSIFLALSPHGSSGLIQARGTRYVISSGENGAMPTVAYDIASPAGAGINLVLPTCDGGVLAPGEGAAPVTGELNPYQSRAYQCRRYRIAVDCDQEFTANRFGGNAANAQAYATTLLGAVSEIYMREMNVQLELAYLRTWTTTDPYTAPNNSEQLPEFAGYWNTNMGHVNRALAHLLSARGLGGGIAYLRQACGGSGYGVSANMNGFFPYPIQDHRSQNWDLMVVAHELGHNLGTGHTHDINSYNPIIDGCGNGDCSNAWSGTIMSYCHTCSGGMSNMSMIMGPRVVDAMRRYLDGVLCGTNFNPSAIAQQPASTTVTDAQTITLSVGISGPAPLSYQWKKGFATVENDARVSGATTGTLTIINPVITDAGSYTCVIETACGRLTTGAANVIVNTCPYILQQPASIESDPGDSVTLLVYAGGAFPRTYQWRKDGQPVQSDPRIFGASSNAMTISGVQPGDAGAYDVVISNVCGELTSEAAVLTVAVPVCGTSDFDGDGDFGTDADIEAFFACLGGDCCGTCFAGGSDFNGDGDVGTDADIESFFRVLGGGSC